MRNTEMQKLSALVGTWTTTISGAWFLDDLTTEIPGTSTVEWLGESLLLWRSTFHDPERTYLNWTLVLGRSDANDTYIALYEDERGVCREYAMTYAEATGAWTLERKDPDMHQRFLAQVDKDTSRIEARWEASEDAGDTWRKDFDVTFERSA